MKMKGSNIPRKKEMKYIIMILNNLKHLWKQENPSKYSHTIYTRNNMGQKCEGNCGLWVLNEINKKIYPENLKKIWVEMGWIGCAI